MSQRLHMRIAKVIYIHLEGSRLMEKLRQEQIMLIRQSLLWATELLITQMLPPAARMLRVG